MAKICVKCKKKTESFLESNVMGVICSECISNHLRSVKNGFKKL